MSLIARHRLPGCDVASRVDYKFLERENHVIAIIGDAVAVQGLNQIFNKVIDETRQLLDCKILIDFQDSILKILPSDMTSRHTGRVIKGEARWFAHAKSLR